MKKPQIIGTGRVDSSDGGSTGLVTSKTLVLRSIKFKRKHLSNLKTDSNSNIDSIQVINSHSNQSQQNIPNINDYYSLSINKEPIYIDHTSISDYSFLLQSSEQQKQRQQHPHSQQPNSPSISITIRFTPSIRPQSLQMNTNQSSLINRQSQLDQQRLSILKKQIALTKSQLLQLAYDDEKFLHKLYELNHLGFTNINQQNYSLAIIYLTEAENILQYAASCGKTIERGLIIGTLQNQACVYHRMWQLDKSINYIEAIIYNITSFLENQHPDFKLPALQQLSQQNIKTSLYLKNKLHLVFYYLQFCAVSSQNQSHQSAFQAASKALKTIKQICQDEYNLQRVARKNSIFYTVDEEHHLLLLQLYNIKDCLQQQTQQSIQKKTQKFLFKAKKTYMKFKSRLLENKQRYPKIQKQLQTYSIGNIMQIMPTELTRHPQQLDLKQQLQYINKLYKAIYISICHFTMATELRLLSSEKFPIDLQLRKSSTQYKSSQLHHLIAIITIGLYLPCETHYYQHILNSFKNHYGVDITQKDSQISITSDYWNDQDDDLIHLQTSSLNLKKDTNQSIESNNQLLSCTKLKNSSKLQDINPPLSTPDLYTKMKKGMSKTKLSSSQRQSQKNIKNSAHQQLINQLNPQSQKVKSKSKSKSKSKGKSVKKSNLKDSSKSRKKSKKIQEKMKSPSIHKKPDIEIKKKVSEVKEKKNSDVKGPSRSKTKSRKKVSRSRHEIGESKQKQPLTKSSHNLIPTVTSCKKLPPNINNLKVEKQKTQKPQKIQKPQKSQLLISKTLSNNVYIQRSNNQLGKDKNGIKKQYSSINSVTSSGVQSQTVSQKLITLKKNKSPASYTATPLAQKQSRSLKKTLK